MNMTELKSNAEWKQWGRDDPMWAAASWSNKRKGASTEWTEEDFYAIGESDWRGFLDHWRQYGIDTGSCLEIGCGAGRITRQLAGSFDRVYAVDVSEHMINRAREALGGGNVEFSVTDGLHLPQRNCAVKAIFSTHVLQHLDSIDIGFLYFREMFRALDAGGTIMIHLPLYEFPNDTRRLGVLMHCLHSIYRRFDNIRAHLQRRLGVKMMRGTAYPIRPLNLFLSGLGFKNIEFRIFPAESNGDLHAFVFAAK